MRKYVLLLLFLAFAPLAVAQEVLQFTISKPYCIFNFLETATGQQATSPTLRAYMISNIAQDSVFRRIRADFSAIKLDYHYQLDDYPTNRNPFRSTRDLLSIALVNSATIEDFKQKMIGILPLSEQQKLVSILEQATPYYDRLIWQEHEAKLRKQQRELTVYLPQATEMFHQMKHFYRSAWTDDIPFLVALYPIPGQRGVSTATPHANSLCVGVLTDETRYIERMGVVLHEMCHVLYKEQLKEFQYQMEQWFDENPSLYKSYAANFFDEALATAIGNGWAYKKLSGSLDEKDWYNNPYINGFAKSLYPLVEEYMDKKQHIDQAFVDQAIALFEAKFPATRTDYGILLNRVSIYNDAETAAERANIFQTLGEHFQLTSVNSSSPILAPRNLEALEKSNQTQLIIIDKNQQETLNALKNIFPQLDKVKAVQLKTNALFSFYDESNRPIIILYTLDPQGMKTLVQKMKTLNYFSEKEMIQQ